LIQHDSKSRQDKSKSSPRKEISWTISLIIYKKELLNVSW
jgi:hypothetical protein